MMSTEIESNPKEKKEYDLVPPDGAWGYMIVVGVGLIFIAGSIPATLFGMIYGQFLAGITNEIASTALINTVCSVMVFFSGLPASYLLQKYSYRKVALMGAICYFLGAFFGMFVTRVFHLILTFGILIGVGFGLLLPSGFTAFNEYFQRRRNVALSICHTIVGFAGMIFPVITSCLMQEYGFRGTAAIYAAFSLHLILAAIVFQPIEWHYKKQEVEEWELVDIEMFVKNTKSIPKGAQTDKISSVKAMESSDQGLINNSRGQILSTENTKLMHNDLEKPSLQNLEALANDEQSSTIWQFIVKNLDLTLFNDFSYIILTFGAAMARASEVTFLSLIPALLTAYGFDRGEMTTTLTIFFTADLIGRIFLSVVNGLFKIWNRYIFLTGALFSGIFLIAFTITSSFEWVVVVCAGLGFLRCFIQIAFPLMFAEKYGSRFKTAFSMNMVVCGFVTLFVGGLSGYVEYAVGSYTVMVYLLVIAYLLCAIPWIIEIFLRRGS